MYYIYILYLNTKQFYTGTTGNLRQRLKEHQSGRVRSTCFKRPLKLIHYEVYLFKEDAFRREKYLKTTEGKRFLKQQLKVLFSYLAKHSPRHATGRPVE